MGHFLLEAEAGLLHLGRLEVRGERGDSSLRKLRQTWRQGARGRTERTIHQGIWILRKDLMIVVVGIIQEEIGGGEPVIGRNGGSINLRNASVEPAVSPSHYERPLVAERVCYTHARSVIIRAEGNLTGIRPQPIG